MNKFYCAAPWRSLHIAINGDVKTCCAGAPNYLGNLNTQSIESVVTGARLKEIRQSIQQGEPHPTYCQGCVESERYGQSERSWHNNINPEFDPSTADLDDYRPTLLDARWNLTCNLSCNYCDESFSSRWQALKQGIPIKQTARTYYSDVCDYLEQHKHHLKEVALVGGEPLLMPENDRLLDLIPLECVITVITNFSRNLETNSIFQKLSQRPRVGWSMSFDNIGPQFEYVRYGAKWDQVVNNIDLFKNLQQRGHWGGIHAVYNIYNCTRLVKFKQWAHEHGLTIVWQNLSTPHGLDPSKHGTKLKQLALDEIEQLFEQKLIDNAEQQFFDRVRQNLIRDNGDATQEFQTHIAKIEQQYHTDKLGQFRSLWPELAFLLDT
jgi:MoaA/NifB/PqqE/SkfB family radical SAM enzyme